MKGKKQAVKVDEQSDYQKEAARCALVVKSGGKWHLDSRHATLADAENRKYNELCANGWIVPEMTIPFTLFMDGYFPLAAFHDGGIMNLIDDTEANITSHKLMTRILNIEAVRGMLLKQRGGSDGIDYATDPIALVYKFLKVEKDACMYLIRVNDESYNKKIEAITTWLDAKANMLRSCELV